MLDRITLRGVKARGYHGVLREEREQGQTFVVDVSLGVDARPAAAADDLKLTVHYGELAEDIVGVVSGKPVDLIETLAQRIACVCLDRPGVVEAEVTVHKPEAPITVPFDDVAVTVVRAGTQLAGVRASRGV